jgi:hypothetical protein
MESHQYGMEIEHGYNNNTVVYPINVVINVKIA